jgi:hypothetical protein
MSLGDLIFPTLVLSIIAFQFFKSWSNMRNLYLEAKFLADSLKAKESSEDLDQIFARLVESRKILEETHGKRAFSDFYWSKERIQFERARAHCIAAHEKEGLVNPIPRPASKGRKRLKPIFPHS